MPIRYDSEGHIEHLSAHSIGEARLVVHELNLKRNEYAATLQRINEQLAVAQPKPQNATLTKMLGAFGKKPAGSSTEPWVCQLEERKAEFEQYVEAIDNHITQIQGMIAERGKSV